MAVPSSLVPRRSPLAPPRHIFRPVTLPAFRPRSATELVDAAIQLGRRHFAPLITLGAVIAVPSLLLGLMTMWLMPQSPAAEDPLANSGGVLLAMLVSMCWLFVGFGALVASASAAYVDGRALEPLAALRQALRRTLPLVGAHLVAALALLVAVTLATLLLALAVGMVAAFTGVLQSMQRLDGTGPEVAIFAGIVTLVVVVVFLGCSLLLSAYFVNISAVVMLEGAGIGLALRRATSLVRGALGRTAGVIAIMWVLYAVVYVTALALTMLLVRSFEIANSVASVLAIALYPFLACMLVLVYYDLRIRREGFDLELMSRALEAETPAGVSP